MKCSQKVWYPNAVLAEEARRKLVQRAGHDHAQKRLVVYPCRDCGKFHVGHNRRSFGKTPVEKPTPEPMQEKLPTWGQLRRKFERMQNRYDRHTDYVHRQRAIQIIQRAQQDLDWLQSQSETAYRARELRESAELAAKLYGK